MTWLTGWNYQKQLYISSTNSTTQSSYQMKIIVYYGTGTDSTGNIYCGGNVNTDFSDIRFTDTDGTTLLNYWIESYTLSSNAIVWIKIPSIPTGSNSIYIYFYYNNPSATTSSNGANTFDFFDDFNDTSIDTTKWNTAEMSGAWTESGGTLNITVPGSSDDRFLLSTPTYKFKNCSIKTRFKATTGAIRLTPRTIGVSNCSSYNFPNPGYYCGAWPENSRITIASYSNCAANPLLTATQAVSINIWHNFEVSLYENFIKVNFDDGIYANSITDNAPILATERHGLNCRSPAGAATYNFDFYLVRKFVNPEPTWGTIVTGSLSISSAPPGAEIYLNGIDQNTTTTSLGTTISNLSPDTYNILLRLTGYADWTGTVTISSGTTTSISVTISPLTNWHRRKRLYINGTTTGTQSSYQMKLTVNYGTGTDSAGNIYCGGNVNTDFSDIRFIDTDGTTLLNYWIESYTASSSANVWIQIPSIPTGSNSAYIYFYYNNPSATTASNGTNTFVLYTGLQTTFYLSALMLNGTGGYVFRANAQALTGGSVGIDFGLGTSIARWPANSLVIEPYGGYTGYWWYNTISKASTLNHQQLTSPTYNNLQPYTYDIFWVNSTLVRMYKDGVQLGNDFTSNIPIVSLGIFVNNADASSKVNWALVRKYASPEPTWGSTISTEQNAILNINSVPTGAEILLAFPSGTSYVDQGIQTNTTIYVTGSSAQNYDIKLTLGGYLDWILTSQTFLAGYTYNIQAILTPIPGSLSISSTPTGAEIYINDTDQHTTTSLSGTTISNLSPGTYNIRLTLAGYQDWTGTANVVTNSITPVSAIFAGSAYITSTPSGAEIYLAVSPNTPVDQNITTSSIITNLTATSSGATTTWNYKLTLSGYADTSGSFTAAAGQTITAPVTFPGNLYITSIPTGASVYIDGVLQQ